MDSDSLYFFALLLFWAVVILAPLAVVMWIVYYLASLPFRWLERARLFLDVIEAGLNEGIAPEQAVMAVSDRHERAVGVRFHLLSAWLEKGLRLGAALEKVPRLLPPQIVALLRVGEETGDLKRVLPAGRKALEDDLQHTRDAEGGVVALANITTCAGIYIFFVLSVFVFPKMEEMVKDMEATPPALFVFLAQNAPGWLLAQVLFLVATWAAVLVYLGGPHMAAWLESCAPRFSGWIFHWLPWRYKRMQRDFSLMVALLLDAGVHEEKAVQLAADFTANGIFKQRAQAVIADLRRGVKLPEAVRRLDNDGEFCWRLSFGTAKARTFTEALAGWHLALEAKAAQQERTATSTTTLALVLWNGVSVGVICVTIFSFLICMFDAVSPW